MTKSIVKKPKRDAEYIKRAQQADADALALRKQTRDRNRPEIEAYVQANPPSPAVIAGLLWGLQGMHSRNDRPDALGKEIFDILKRGPHSASEVLAALAANANTGGAVEEVRTDGTVVWTDEKQSFEVGFPALTKRINRIRKKIMDEKSR
jgi:hypothetical protein